jgi:hypothetical protein
LRGTGRNKSETAQLPRLSWQQPVELAVVRMSAEAPWPAACSESSFYSVTRAPGETSIVLDASLASRFKAEEGVEVETGWTMFKLEGPLDFSLIGILSKIATVLAVEGISIFAVSTYDTDWVLIKMDKRNAAMKALACAGYTWA